MVNQGRTAGKPRVIGHSPSDLSTCEATHSLLGRSYLSIPASHPSSVGFTALVYPVGIVRSRGGKKEEDANYAEAGGADGGGREPRRCKEKADV